MLATPLRMVDARRLGIVIALPAEARTLNAITTSELDIAITGPGPRRAEAGARVLVERGVGALLSWGTSGALVPDLRAGQLLLAEHVRDAQGIEYTSDGHWLALAAGALSGLDARTARCATVERPVTTRQAKQRLAADSGCIAVDMEAATVAAMAAMSGLPFLAIRSIVDPVDCDLPRSVLAGLDAAGGTNVPALLGSLLRRPWEVAALLRLALHFGSALRTLREAAVLLAPPSTSTR